MVCCEESKEHHKIAPAMLDITRSLTYPPLQPVNLKIEITAILNQN